MTRTATHPIERTLADAARLNEWFAASPGCAGTSLALLVADGHELGAAVERTCTHHETDERRIGAGFLLGAIA